MKTTRLISAMLLLALCPTCSRQTSSTPEPKLPRTTEGPAHVKPVPVPLVFFFGDQYKRLFIRLSGDDWKLDEAVLGKPALEYHQDVVTISRTTTEKSPLSGTHIDIYRDSTKACSQTVGDLVVLSRAYPHFGARDDLGVPSEQGKVPNPKFADLLSQASHHLAVGFDDCGTRPAGGVNEFIWARPTALGEPVIWTPVGEEDGIVKALKPRVAELVMALDFGKTAGEYAKRNPEEMLVVTTSVFGNPAAQEYLVEDHHQIGETTCGGDGHELWSLWRVVEGKPQLLWSEDMKRKVRLAADLDNDGFLEIVTQDGYYGNERTLWRLREGKLDKIKEDKYPFNDCGC